MIGPRSRFRINNIVTLLLLCCLAGLLAWLSVRYQTQVDLTQSRRHTLSHASQEVLERMTGAIEITAYVRENISFRQEIKEFVQRYQRLKPDIKLHFLDPHAVPDAVRSAGISVHGEMVLQYQGRSEHVKGVNEEKFTNALARLARGTKQWLTFLEGHGERDPLGKANHDLGLWAKKLIAQGFNVQPLNLVSVPAIPHNTKVLVITAPTIKLLAGEIARITEYLAQGGNILWLAEPGDLHGLEILAKQLGLTILPGLVIDSSGSLIGIEDPTIVLSTPSLYPDHAITKGLDYTTLFPRTAAIQIDNKEAWNISKFLISAADTWLETSPTTEPISYDKINDKTGPFNIGIALEKHNSKTSPDLGSTKDNGQRVIVIGDGDFLSNTYVENGGNLDLGIRLIDWLSNNDDFINIPARTINDAHLTLSPISGAIIGFGFILILPLIFLTTGLTIWYQRKKQ